MTHEMIRTPDGLSLYLESHIPAEKPHALLLIVHGRGEHTGIFQHVIEFFVKRNLVVLMYDQRGHGKSGGRRSHVIDFSEYVSDLTCMLKKAHAYTLPVFILSHSIGAMVSLLYLNQVKEQTPVKKVVFMGMPLIPTVKAPWLKVKAGLLCARFLPTLPFSTGIRPEDVTTNPAKIKERAEDPLYYHAITAGWYAAYLKAIETLTHAPYSATIPALFLHGGSDGIMDPQGSQLAFDRYPSPEKDIEIYPGRGHELHNERDYEVILARVEGWFEVPLRSRREKRL